MRWQQMNPKRIFDLFQESIVGWFGSDAALHAAALAYYTIFSLAPLLILSLAIATKFFTQAAVEGEIVTAIEQTVGEPVAIVIQDIIVNSGNITSGGIAPIITILILLYGASTVFHQLRNSLNAMWGIVPKADSVPQNLIAILKARLLSASAVLMVGGLLLVSLLLNTLWTAIPQEYTEGWLDNIEGFEPLLQLVASPLIFMLIFAVIFKTLPKAKIRWRDVWPGAAVTALLFWLGSYLVGLYLGYSTWTSVYGAAGSLIAFLIWVYYSTWIFLFGAKFTQVYAYKFGRPIVPDADARFSAPQQLEELEPFV